MRSFFVQIDKNLVDSSHFLDHTLERLLLLGISGILSSTEEHSLPDVVKVDESALRLCFYSFDFPVRLPDFFLSVVCVVMARIKSLAEQFVAQVAPIWNFFEGVIL